MMIKRWMRRLTLVLGVVLTLMLLTGCRKSVSLMKYVDFVYGGFDGKGTVEGVFDAERFIEDFSVPKEYQKAVEKIKVKTNAKKNLSNGDTIVVSILYSSDLEDGLKLKFTDVSAQVIVDGLSEGEPFDAFKNVEILYEGVNGYATASFKVEDPNLTEENFVLVAENNGTLSNGDKITLQLVLDEEAFLDETGLIPEATEKEIVVEGVEEGPTYNYFNDLLVGFLGKNGDGTVDLALTNESPIEVSEFSVDKASGLTNGDTITVSLEKDDKYYLDTYGFLPTQKSETYTADGLPDMITKVSDVDADTLADLKKSVERYFNNYVDDYWSKDESLESLTYLGSYLQYTDDQDAELLNVYWLIYEVKVKNKDIDAPFTYYWTIGYRNVELNSDGTVTVTKKNNYYKVSDGKGSSVLTNSVQVGNYKYYGYETVEDLLDAIDKAIGTNYYTDDNL